MYQGIYTVESNRALNGSFREMMLLGDTASPERSGELYDGFIKYASAGSVDKTGADSGKDAGAKK